MSTDEVEELEGQKDQEVKDKGEDKDKVIVPPSPYKPPIPYPQRLKHTKIDNQYKKFIKMIEKFHVEIPFTKVITQIPSYAEFLKEILTNKRRLDDPKPLECNSIAENKLSKKEKYLGSFSIPCILGNHVIDKAFLDLGASVSLMPLAVYRRLNLGELQPTKISLQLVDRSVKYPIGILEDIPVRIGQLYIPTDFVVMDIKEDDEIPILLGRPFLSIAGAIIDVKRGKLTFEVGDEKIEFILSKFLMAPVIEDSCYAIDIIDECIRELDQEGPPEKMKFPSTPIRGDDIFGIKPYMDDNLHECLALTPNHMPCPKKPSIELKELPKNLRYEFLDEELNHPVIVRATLKEDETNQLLDILQKYPLTLGYNIFDLKGISPSVCMHRILLEEDSKPSREHQRRINPIMSDVVKKEVLKLLEAGIIYQISDSKWVSPIHVVPKKGGATVVENEKGKHVAKRVENGWLSEKGIEVDKAKIEVIENLKPPKTIKEVRIFFGHAGFCRRFIKDFSRITKPLTSLLMKDIEFIFDEKCIEAFNLLKQALISAPIMQPPDWDQPFEIMCDASDYAVGAVLWQRKDKKLHVIYYASRTLDAAQLNYATIEKELLPVVFAIDKF
ncbi:uncharacterized protein LOC127093866 [Lathyrus oleraceus]|uniref:uncharacterized protein LOC127093866 n=1 Tax=Pisum sativum TaxID=3888 RepID=UPI0021D37316|nr:uncharacterized protein LOC127093866 [Pisum sativum]